MLRCLWRVRASNALGVVPHLVAATRVVEANSRAIGVDLNFGEKKTAGICVCCGPRSREAKRRHLVDPVPKAVVDLADGRHAELCLVEAYQHLGGVVDHTGSCLKDIECRRRSSNAVCKQLRRAILPNPVLSLVEKADLLTSLVLNKFSFGAGGWVLGTQNEQRAFRSAVMSFQRMCFRPIAKCSAKLLNDEEINKALGLPWSR